MIRMTGKVRKDRLKQMDPRKKKRLLKKYARVIVALLRFYTPKRTGHLRNGWKMVIKDDKFIIVNEVGYGKWLDNGTVRAIDKTKGYMTRKAIEYAKKQFRADEQHYLANLLLLKKEY